MTLETTLANAQGGDLIKNLATSFGVPRDQTERAVAVMTQALTDHIDRNTLSRGGIADVVSLLQGRDVTKVVDDPQIMAAPEVRDAGDNILDVLIGSKHTSRGIAARAAAESGLKEDVLKKMLPAVAGLVIGSLQKEATPLFAERLKGVQGLTSAGGSPLPLPGDTIPPISRDIEPAPRFPQPGSGSGGIGGTVGGGGGGPLPIPGDDIPGVGRNAQGGGYERLPDIVRRGGTQVPGGGDLGDVIRSILGSLLGFQPRGLFGWILNLILSRWFLGFVVSMLSRIFRGR